MRVSARNQLKGKVIDVRTGRTTSLNQADIGGRVLTASITNGAVDDLGLKPGQDACAVIKASNVMVAVD